MTVGFYGYIGQNYIFAYSNSKTSKLQKKKSWKKNLKKVLFFCGPAVALRGGYFEKFLWAYSLSQFGNFGTILFVWRYANSKNKKKWGGWGWENYGEGSKTPRKHLNSMEVNFNRF